MHLRKFNGLMKRKYRFRLQFGEEHTFSCSPMEVTYDQLKNITRQNIDAFKKYEDASDDYLIDSWRKVDQCIQELKTEAKAFELSGEIVEDEDELWGSLLAIINSCFASVGSPYTPENENIEDGLSIGIESPCICDRECARVIAFLDHLLEEKSRREWEIEFASSLAEYVTYSQEPRYLFQNAHQANLNSGQHLAFIYSLEEEIEKRTFQWKDVAEAVHPLQKELESSRRLLEGTSRDFSSEILSQENRMEEYKASIDRWVQEKEDSLTKLERLYSDKLALAAPKEHWDGRAAQEKENAAHWAKITALTAIIAVVLSTIAIVVLYSFDLPKIPFLSTSFIAIAMITFMIYLVRVFVKITLSSRHLQMAYEQKSALTYFYLSLGKHKGELTEEERVLVIQSLFTPVDSGLVKASELPDFNAALALLTKRAN